MITGDIRYNNPIKVIEGVLGDTGRRGCTFDLAYDSNHFSIGSKGLTLSNSIVNFINSTRSDLDSEISNRANADTQLQNAIDAERNERKASDTSIRQEIQSTKSSLEESLKTKLTVDNINAGTNITIDKNGNNITINSVGGSIDNLVTLNTTQSITGQKTFTKQVNVPKGVLRSADGVFVIEGDNNANIRINNLTIKKGTTGSTYGLELSGGSSGSRILFDKADLHIRNFENHVYPLLHYGNLTSKDGSIEITYNETTNTVDLKATGGGGGAGDVTAAGNNRFTGDNTFTGKVNIAGGALTVDGLATLNQTTAQYLNAVSITSSGEINAVSIKANALRSDDIHTTENKKYLTELDVDNQTIQVVNGKLHANLDGLGNEVNDLSSRVTANEADISAIKTGKQNKLTAGNNITLTDLTDGTVRVDAAGVENIEEALNLLNGGDSTLLDSKQNTLISGTNIKTINNESILGAGNITISGGGSNYTAGTDISISADNVISVSKTIPSTTSSVTSGDTSALTSGGAYTNLVRRDELYDVIPVISRIISGTSQVTIWADGYCEQKGFMVRTGTKDTVSLVKNFLNTDYNINVQVRHTADNTDGRPTLIREVTTTSFTINSHTAYQGFYWIASGQLAEGEY